MYVDITLRRDRSYVEAANVGMHGACHQLRHPMATSMLEGVAATGFFQAMLGHADLKTAQICTQVAARQLQEIHRATHPAQPPKDKLPVERTSQDAADVFAALKAEAAEDPEA